MQQTEWLARKMFHLCFMMNLKCCDNLPQGWTRRITESHLAKYYGSLSLQWRLQPSYTYTTTRAPFISNSYLASCEPFCLCWTSDCLNFLFLFSFLVSYIQNFTFTAYLSNLHSFFSNLTTLTSLPLIGWMNEPSYIREDTPIYDVNTGSFWWLINIKPDGKIWYFWILQHMFILPTTCMI